MTEQLTIARLGHRGDGVADTATGAAFVPYTLPGETVTVEAIPGHPDRRRLLSVDSPSPERIEPVCIHFGVCGGCAMQHWSLPEYLVWKRGQVVETLAQHGIDAPVDAVIDAHGKGRRRAVLHARRGHGDVLEVGFAAPRAHHIIAIDMCPILAPGLAGTIPISWAIAELLKPTNKPLDIHVTASDHGLDIDVRGSGPLPSSRLTQLAKLAEQYKIARITRHGELVIQRVEPALKIGRALVPLPPGAFLQATAEGEAVLAALVLKHLGKSKRVADLFCGLGTFALRIGEFARVLAIDSEASAMKALERGIHSAPGLKPIEMKTRDLFRSPLGAMEMKGLDAVVFDPPRQGAERQAQELALAKVPLVISVSCDASTFARDARILIDGGYKLTGVTPVDQFRYSHHVEVVGRFER